MRPDRPPLAPSNSCTFSARLCFVLQVVPTLTLSRKLLSEAVPASWTEPLYDPTAWKDHETLGSIGPLDDLEGSFADPAQRLPEFVASIAAIGKHVAQPGKRLTISASTSELLESALPLCPDDM